MAGHDTPVWSRVRLELARSHRHPDGNPRDVYLLVLPLDGAGRIDIASYAKALELCTVHRLLEGEDEAVGRIVRRGAHGWAFDYHAKRADDEPVPHLAEHVFRVGEYLAVREAGGTEHVFRIVSVVPVPGLAPAGPP